MTMLLRASRPRASVELHPPLQPLHVVRSDSFASEAFAEVTILLPLCYDFVSKRSFEALFGSVSQQSRLALVQSKRQVSVCGATSTPAA